MAENNAIGLRLAGRRKIFSTAAEITDENVVQEVNSALVYHLQNIYEEEYLYWYRRGIQPILARQKEIRPEINNKVVINNADMVCHFKNGYFLTKSCFYSARKSDEEITDKVKELNEYLFLSGKQDADNEVTDWFHTVGLGVVYVQPDQELGAIAYALDPRCAFVVYSMYAGNKPLMGVNVVNYNGVIYVDVYTESKVYKMVGGATGTSMVYDTKLPEVCTVTSIDSVYPNAIGEIPIIEYQYNSNRMSSFENSISIMDTINLIESNRADGIEQFIQSLVVAVNCDLPEGETANSIRQSGMIVLKSVGENKADFKILSEQLDQKQTQTTLDDLYTQMLEKCGVPSSIRDAGSTSDNVGAVYLRNGWAVADTDARNTEDLFRKSNRLFDKVFLKILNKTKGLELNWADFELKFPRNDMSNMIAKTQAALNMKALGFAPELAFERSGLSNDPLNDASMSKDYIEATWKKGAIDPANERTVPENTDEVKNPWNLTNDNGGDNGEKTSV